MPKDHSSEIIEKLILAGAMEISGLDADTGEFLYSFTEKLKEVDNGLFHHVQESINNKINYLWEQGFLEMDFDSEDPVVVLTEKINDEEAVSKLSEENRSFLKTVISKFE